MLWDRLSSDDLPHINMTPMVDVVLCLLVFFMAATRLYDWDESQFQVRVPEVADAAPLTAPPDDLVLTIVGPGRVAVGDSTTPLDLKALTAQLVRARENYPDQGVLVRGDAGLNYQHLADVLAVCEAAQLRNIRLGVQTREEAAAAPGATAPQPSTPRPRPAS